MQFFWKHLHNNKGDENVSKLIWIVIAFVIGALLLSTMSVAFRTEGEGSVGGWLNSTIDSWFGEADGRDGSTGGGTGSGGGLGGGGGSGGGAGGEAGGSNDVPIVLKWNGTNLTSDLGDGNTTDYTDMFTGLDEGYKYAVSAYPSSSSTGADADESISVLGEEYAIAQTAVSPFKSGTMMLVANNGTTTGVDDNGNILVTGLSSAPATTYAVYNQGTVGIESAGSDEEESLIHSGTIPAGGTYYVGVTTPTLNSNGYESDCTTMLTAGDEFPKTVSDGDVYVYGDYEYRYNMYYHDGASLMWVAHDAYSYDWCLGLDVSGWGVRVLDNNKTNYGNILEEINQNPVTFLNYCFYKCTSITEFPTIPKHVTTMYSAFKQCTSLSTMPDLSKCTNLINMQYAFSNCTNLINVSAIPDKVTDMTRTFYGCKALTVAPAIGKSVTIMYLTFENCTSLTIGPDISNCTSLTNMNSTFYGCTSLSEVSNIPENVTNMFRTFDGCTSLTTAPNLSACKNLTQLGSTFENCTQLKDVSNLNLPDSLTSMESSFAGCSSLKTAPIIPKNVTVLAYTFQNCSSLISAPFIHENIIQLVHTFDGCTSLTGTVQIGAKNMIYTEQPFNNTIKPITIKVPAGSETYTLFVNSMLPSNVTIQTF